MFRLLRAPCVSARRLLSASPSSTTSVLLRHLPAAATQQTLQSAVRDVRHARKAEIEPGLSAHVLSEAEALHLGALAAERFGTRASLSSTCMPALLLANVPVSVTAEALLQAFGKHAPCRIALLGTASAECRVGSVALALRLRNALAALTIEGARVQAEVLSLGASLFAVRATNLSAAPSVVLEALHQACAPLAAPSQAPAFSYTPSQPVHAVVRVDAAGAKAAAQTLATLTHKGVRAQVSAPRPVLKSALFVRNLERVGERVFLDLLRDEAAVERVEWSSAAKDRKRDLAVVYCRSEEGAAHLLARLKGLVLDDRKLSVSYREVVEPAVRLSNVPSGTSVDAVKKLFAPLDPLSVQRLGRGATEFEVTLRDMRDVEIACSAVSNKVVGDSHVKVAPLQKMDVCVEVRFPGAALDRDELRALLGQVLGEAMRGVSVHTNASAMLGFESIEQAVRAQSAFQAGAVSLQPLGISAATTASRISILPSFSCELVGLSVDTPVLALEEALAADGLVGYRKLERKAVVKFTRHMHVLPGMAALGKLALDGCALRPERYQPLVGEGPGEYDAEGDAEDFDRFSLRAVLKDYLHADPATRFLIAKNRFERALHDAKAFADISHLLRSSASSTVRREAEELLKAQVPDKTRLFELFMQREDMDAFSKDFRALETQLGPMDEDDPFDWSQFRMDSEEEVLKLEKAMQELEGRGGKPSKGARPERAEVPARPAQVPVQLDEADTLFADEEETYEGLATTSSQARRVRMRDAATGEERMVEDHRQLRDQDEHLWSGVILNNDTTQKITPGVRILSFRTLVVVGNGRGTAGFGKGKGLTADLSLASAFRDALRNLTHVDLYDNFGLAQDLYGKHNSCHAYVRATPVGRAMVGSEFATSILHLFGISSASVKFEGRRHPYAMVRALFNAIGKHENLDDIAKSRGKRYLTLRWAYDNGLV